ncbi:MAG: hypothetical protein ABI724_01085 [Betaproteobacteria bacterium]
MPIPTFSKLAVLTVCVVAAWACDAIADPKTICTITVNSSDEKEMFERYLPRDEYRFVELVERGRPDWLASACRQQIRCDALIVSGHFDGGTEFYTDRLDSREFLAVDELERASCSESCPGLFEGLKEVYLFGCNTLNAEAMRSASAEIARSLIRSGHSPADAERLSRLLSERHGESNRDRMRHIFKDVPTLYGFSSKAPLGRAAGPLLERYFQSAPSGEIASGRVSARLVGLFAPSAMTVAAGLTDADPAAGFRRDVCQFSDDRLSDAQKIAFMHDLLGRDMGEVRMFLDHLERYSASLGPARRQAPEAAAAFDAIARDLAMRERYLDFARDADQPAVQVRMMALAHQFGWLTTGQEQLEFNRMIVERMQRNAVGPAEVDLACRRGSGELGQGLPGGLPAPETKTGTAADNAIHACFGSAEGRAGVLRALTSASDDDVAIAQVYLNHRPITDAGELRTVASAIARMPTSDSQVRALDTLAHQHLNDPESLNELARLFPLARSVGVQRAIAGILIRSDYQMLAKADLARALRQHRLKSAESDDVIDVLIRRLQLP